MTNLKLKRKLNLWNIIWCWKTPNINYSLELIEEIKPVVKMKEAEKPNGGISVKINESIKPSVQQSKEPIQVSKKVVLERIGIVEK